MCLQHVLAPGASGFGPTASSLAILFERKKWEAGQIWMAALTKPCVNQWERWSGWVQIRSRMVSRLLTTVLQVIAVTIGMGWATKWNATAQFC